MNFRVQASKEESFGENAYLEITYDQANRRVKNLNYKKYSRSLVRVIRMGERLILFYFKLMS